MIYPNLVEMVHHHPYSTATLADHAGVTTALMEAVIRGEEDLTAKEALGLARLYAIPMEALFCPKLIKLDKHNRKHRNMVNALGDELYVIWEHQKAGSKAADEFMKWRGRDELVNLKLAFSDQRGTYGWYLGVKERVDQCLLSIKVETMKPRDIPHQKMSDAKLPGNIEVVDNEQRVLSIPSANIPEWVQKQFFTDTPRDDINKLSFFYSPKLDTVVINRDNQSADIYELLVVTYLNVGESERQRLRQEVTVDIVGTALELLDHIIEERKKN